MPVSIRAGKVRKVPPPAKAFWMPAHTATRKRMISAVIVPLWHVQAKLAIGLGKQAR
jgi:hypothetical protein